jgi:hypothetical protein
MGILKSMQTSLRKHGINWLVLDLSLAPNAPLTSR